MVGILGGVGPMATVTFMEMLLRYTRADCDQEHLDMMVSNHSSIPDRTAFILGTSRESPLPAMAGDARMLEQAGCDFLVLPCNTAHFFYEGIRAQVSVPLLNIIELTIAQCLADHPGIRTVGVLATEGTAKAGTYDLECKKHGLACRYPDPELQEAVTGLIYGKVKAGKPVGSGELTAVIGRMKAAGCEAVVLGCTELSVAYCGLPEVNSREDVVDSLTVLAKQTIQFAGKELRVE